LPLDDELIGVEGPNHVALDRHEPTLRNVGVAARRRWGLIFTCVMVSLAAAAVATVLMPPTFEATTLIRLDPKFTALPDMLAGTGASEMVATELQFLDARGVAADVVREKGLQVVLVVPADISRDSLVRVTRIAPNVPAARLRLDRDGTGWALTAESNAGWLHAAGAVSYGPLHQHVPANGEVTVPGATLLLRPVAAGIDHAELKLMSEDEAIAALRKHLKFDRPDREADIISMSYRGANPVALRDVLNTYAAHFIARREGLRKTENRSAVVSLRQQIDTLTRALTTAEDTLRAFRETNQMVRADVAASDQVDRAIRLQTERDSLETERAALGALLASAQRDSNTDTAVPPEYSRLIGSSSLVNSPAAAELVRALEAAEADRSTLLNRRKPDDPDVRALSVRIQAINQRIEEFVATHLTTIDGQIAGDDRVLGSYRLQLSKIPSSEVQLVRRERGVNTLAEMVASLQSRLKEAEVSQGIDDPTLQIADTAIAPQRPIRPIVPLNLLAGVVFGLVVGVALVTWRALRDRSVWTRKDVAAACGLSVIAVIPHVRLSGPWWRPGVKPAETRPQLNGASARTRDGPKTRASAPMRAGLPGGAPVFEAYTRLALAVRRSGDGVGARPDHQARCILVTSPMPGDGKSTSARHLAATLALKGDKVLLIDADLRRGAAGRKSGNGTTAPGFAESLASHSSLDRAIQTLEVAEGTTIDVLPAGYTCADMVSLLTDPHLAKAISQTSATYEFIVLDGPPALVADVALLAGVADGVVVVVRAERTDADALRIATQQLVAVGAPLIGVLLNDVDLGRAARYDAELGYYHAVFNYAGSAGR
jgi:capsular exopolysaccharide synthesis family protein